MKHVRKLFRPLAGSALVLTGLGAVAAPASAVAVGCGTVITQSTTLTSDVGPCSGDGIIVMGSNITLNLNQKRIFAAHPCITTTTGTPPVTSTNCTTNGPGDNAGIRVVPRPPAPGSPAGTPPTFSRANTIRNGTVEGFDAGVLVVGGGGNTINTITAQNNVNDLNVAGTSGDPCDLGDGISLLDSSNNTVSNNSAIHNGPFAGISVVGDSNRNVIRNNFTRNNNIQGPGCGNPNQDEGIRIEGPGADNNVVQANTVQNSLLAGIGLHGYVCNATPTGQQNGAPNQGTQVTGNTVSGSAGDPGASYGIGFLEQGPAGVVCAAFRATVKDNTSRDNEGEGIFVPQSSHNNTISSNTVLRNGRSGILLQGPVTGNTFTNVGPSLFDQTSPDLPPFTERMASATTGGDFVALSGSGSGDVTGRVVPVGNILIAPSGTVPSDTATSGCTAADFTGFPSGGVALIQRGFCDRQTKVDNAVAAGASAVIFFNEGSDGRTDILTSGTGPQPIPVLGTTYALGVQLYNAAQSGPVTVHIVTNTTNVPFQQATGAINNSLNGNFGRNNGMFDGEDDNVNCDNNQWTNNNFVTVNQACVQGGATIPPPAP